MLNLIVFLMIFGLAMINCQTAPDLEKEKENLLNTDIEFSKTSVDKGASRAFHDFCAREAYLLTSEGDPVKGNKAIGERLAGLPENTVLTWKPEHAEVSESADMGVTWGLYKYEIPDKEGNISEVTGRYMNIWKKQSDGKWKVYADIGNRKSEK